MMNSQLFFLVRDLDLAPVTSDDRTGLARAVQAAERFAQRARAHLETPVPNVRSRPAVASPQAIPQTLVDARTAARMLGTSVDFVRSHYRELGRVKVGRLARFDPVRLQKYIDKMS